MVSRAILAGGLALAASGLVAASGCKKEEAKPAAADRSGSQAQAGDAGARKRPSLSKFQGQGLSARLGLEPITIDEVKPLMPALKGGTPLGEPISTARGLRVTAMECLTGDLATIKTDLEARLKELGFATVRASERKSMNILTVSAEKSPYRLSASVRSGPYPDCPADQKKSKLLMSFFKRPPKPPGAPGAAPGAAPGGATPAAPSQPPTQGKVAPQPEGGSKPAAPDETK